MEEIWRPIVGFEDTHEVSSLGRVRRKEHIENRVKVVNGKENYVDVHVKEYYYHPYPIWGGYVGVSWNYGGKQINKMIHRLMAESFIENDDPENKVCVDHIDGNKKNNTLENLRWATYSTNSQNVKQRFSKRPVYCVEDGNRFSSTAEAERFYEMTSETIGDSIRGNMKRKGRTFQYLEGV